MIADWWASRSRAALEKRIAKLEATLARIEALSPLSEFESLVIRTMASIVALLLTLPLMALIAYEAISSDYYTHPLIPNDWYRQFVFAGLAFMYSAVGLVIIHYTARFRLEHSSEYKARLWRDIEELQVRLLQFTN